MPDLSHLPPSVIVLIEQLVQHVTSAGDPEGVARVAEEAARVAAFDQLARTAKP